MEILSYELKEAKKREEETRKELFASQARYTAMEEELSSNRAQAQELRGDMAQLERRERELEVALAESRGRQAAAECEARSWESQLRESREKHFHQLRDERRQLTTKILALKDELMQNQESKDNSVAAKERIKIQGNNQTVLLEALDKLQTLLTEIKNKKSSDGADGISSWSEALSAMTGIVLESDRHRNELTREVSILSWHARSLSEKLFSLELAFDEASTGRMAAEQMLLDLERAYQSQQKLDYAQHEATVNGQRMRIKAIERRENILLEKARAGIEQARSQEMQISLLNRQRIESQRRATAMFSSCVAAMSTARNVNVEDLRKDVFTEADVIGMFAMLSGSPLLTRLSSANISYEDNFLMGVEDGLIAEKRDNIRDIVDEIRVALNGVVPEMAHVTTSDENVREGINGDDRHIVEEKRAGDDSEVSMKVNESILRELIATKFIG